MRDGPVAARVISSLKALPPDRSAVHVDDSGDEPFIKTLLLSGRLDKKTRAAVLEMPRLEALGLSEASGLATDWLRALGELPCLRRIDFHRAALGDDGAAALAASRTLETLDIRNTKVTDVGFAALCHDSRLVCLQCGGQRGLTERGLVELRHLRSLRSLAFIRAKNTAHPSPLTRACLEAIGALEDLERLSLFSHWPRGEHLDALASLERLRYANLGTLQAKGAAAEGLRSLASLPALTELDVNESAFGSVADLHPLAEAPALAVLCISNCKFDRFAVAELAAFARLERLHLGRWDFIHHGAAIAALLPDTVVDGHWGSEGRLWDFVARDEQPLRPPSQILGSYVRVVGLRRRGP